MYILQIIVGVMITAVRSIANVRVRYGVLHHYSNVNANLPRSNDLITDVRHL